MKYGCIGNPLAHSFSPELHAMLGNRDYQLWELNGEELAGFMKNADFDGINVTIPYKKAVMPYLDEISPTAICAGAVNTVVKRDGRLYGYNTDVGGFEALLSHCGVNPDGKKVLVLGTGGASLTACAVLKRQNAKQIYTVSRNKSGKSIGYDEAVQKHGDAQIIINATPVGMFPNADGTPIMLGGFNALEAVVDAVYNPLRTSLVLEGQRRGVKAEGGLYMLAAQAVLASALFFGTNPDMALFEKLYRDILSKKQNIVLIGMPSCGKTTVGRMVADMLSRRFCDTDEIVEKAFGASARSIFEQYGEKCFRDAETAAVRSLASETGLVIATGGGAVLREENVRLLSQNGRLFYLDRRTELLCADLSRPLASSKEALKKLYGERHTVYETVCDERVDANGNADRVAKLIVRGYMK